MSQKKNLKNQTFRQLFWRIFLGKSVTIAGGCSGVGNCDLIPKVA